MNPVRVLIAEDEAPQRRELLRMLQALWPELDIVAECEDGLSALEALATTSPQLAVLDIRMPGVSGIEVAKAAIEAGCLVLFTTAYDEYAVRAFEAGAIDYILKPVREDRLEKALQRARERLNQPVAEALPALLTALQQLPSEREQPLQWITASLGDSVRFIGIEEVLCFQAQDKLTRVLTREGEAFIRTPLKELLRGLDPQQFWQIHRSAIVRAAAIDKVQKDELGRYELSLKQHAERLPVSQAFAQRLRGM
ncbi:LytR/AlgR family response regulator transcription factor [Pseudomarimonas arenosa]|uniref:Response regulator transcription factor n=1 Tax=Pseudomarimonas arenosa TaxID=2774145 RepID=A0AAW3ZQI4_9GAMM|nr:LytTR family DNA-binding domain-containing protein [Pseudomarimonas arenosa]MBD8526889.1 response regulator transcription factor [Pseudomarimonas arenosa]